MRRYAPTIPRPKRTPGRPEPASSARLAGAVLTTHYLWIVGKRRLTGRVRWLKVISKAIKESRLFSTLSRARPAAEPTNSSRIRAAAAGRGPTSSRANKSNCDRSPLLQDKAALAKIVAFVVIASALSACSGSATQQSPSASLADVFDPKAAAQRNYDKSLADYQNCYAANPSNPEACEKQRQMLEASTKVLAGTINPGR